MRAGNGGQGCISFRRESHAPRGGPDGGNGGRGGDVILQTDKHMSTLIDLKYQQLYRAERGQQGLGNQKDGQAGKDVLIRIPCGSMVYDFETEDLLADLVEHGKTYTLAKGGRGGKGNMFFKSSTNQAPRISQPGEPGQQLKVRLELRLLADVGLVGMPNAGKSTLISRISAARPKIADYPFTTLVPNLGVVRYGEYRSYVVADLPGLIEGASRGAGLGHQFLRHIERTRVILHLVDCQSEDPLADVLKLNHELGSYNKDLLTRPQVMLLTKADLVADTEELAPKLKALTSLGHETMLISAVSGVGIEKLVRHVGGIMDILNAE